LSESRQALIFRRLQIQHKPSVEVGEDSSEAQATHFSGRFARSATTDALADSEISLATTGGGVLAGLRFNDLDPFGNFTIAD
jgi:hypothetical protein